MEADRTPLASSIAAIESTSLTEGGFATAQSGDFRPDATAWAVMALRACGDDSELISRAQRRLAEWQGRDGRVAMSKNQPGAFWPTPLAMLAWVGEPESKEALERAANFMLATSGEHLSLPRAIFKHDGSLKGWSWNEGTHSWVVPSSLGLLALKACGHAGHERPLEAVRLLIDRQLPSGGWNYGNTVVFGTELLPIPECTGHALNALAGYVEYQHVATSIEYLKQEVARLRSPLSLVWAILGLGAWSLRPPDFRQRLLECIALQKHHGAYGTDLLAQVLVGYCASGGLLSIFDNNRN